MSSTIEHELIVSKELTLAALEKMDLRMNGRNQEQHAEYIVKKVTETFKAIHTTVKDRHKD
ncbi:hypothetical protein PN4B1_17170 [Paenibacillus naphthalenovorans]|uniref:hypothetical protein n=1 Tax=Paenibacillus naphthalenovorans TaxID=162209 RepID=UPI0010BB6814|nr:hypothetical protein [Paenibacillus naphthalenovorans]GCL71812.1 hypothetical protein PN4B1_17170 [Paenibacillus naphthalenovorans]